MNRFERISQKLTQGLALTVSDILEITDESHQHAGRRGQESHFKIRLVCDAFKGLNRVQRQRRINELLADELTSGLHALTMRLLTHEEESGNSSDFQSPQCQGKRAPS